MNHLHLSVIKSLTIHAIVIFALFIPQTIKPALPSSIIRIHFLHSSDISSGSITVTTPLSEKKQSPPQTIASRDTNREAIHVNKVHANNDDGKSLNTITGNMTDNISKTHEAPLSLNKDSVLEKQTANISVIETKFGSVGAPSFLHKEIPAYPMPARRMGKEGKVVLKLMIDSKGNLRSIEVIESAGFGFTEAAVDAIKKSSFTPASRNGIKVAARAILPIRFRLE
jgi:TonB family protein